MPGLWPGRDVDHPVRVEEEKCSGAGLGSLLARLSRAETDRVPRGGHGHEFRPRRPTCQRGRNLVGSRVPGDAPCGPPPRGPVFET